MEEEQMSNSESQKHQPFPWKCPTCLLKQVRPTRIPYTAEIQHDGILHAVHLPALEVPQCRACGELLFDDHADEQINSALRTYLHLLTPAQICEGRKELGLA